MKAFTLDFTQRNQDFEFVAQMFTTTNAIPYENIQFQTLENTNSYSKKNGKMFLSFNILTFMMGDGSQCQNVAFMTTKIQSYVLSMTIDDYMTTSLNNHVVNAINRISRSRINDYSSP